MVLYRAQLNQLHEHRETKNGDSISRTLIDHIWANQPNRIASSAFLVDSFRSDHLAISCLLQANQSFFPQICNWSSQNLKLFIDALDALPLEKPQDDIKVFKKNLAEAKKKLRLKNLHLFHGKIAYFQMELIFCIPSFY